MSRQKITQSYSLKLPQDPKLRQQIDWLYALGLRAAQHLLERLWSEAWVEMLAANPIKAYKVIGEAQVYLSGNEGGPLYLPSRIRRCIAEQVGRILRSQAKHRKCYYDVLSVVQHTGVEGPLDTLVRTVGLTLVKFHGKYYRWAVIRQTLRLFRRYYYHFGLDLGVLTQIPYTQMVQPVIKAFIFPYAPDDGQAIRLIPKNETIAIHMKLPTTKLPKSAKDWIWINYTLSIPPKIHHRLQTANLILHLPTLRYLILKSGLTLPFLEFAWSFDCPPPAPFPAQRVMTMDLGVINVTTSVICSAGSQISPPIFWSPKKSILHKIEQLYQHISHLQRKLDRYPQNWRGQGKRHKERDRLYRKMKRYRSEILHKTSNKLLKTAVYWQCQKIIIEDLRAYKPPKHKRTLSRKLSHWFRGALYTVLTYKATRIGIQVIRVNPWWTSTYCPRCGGWGQKIRDPVTKNVDNRGRFFHCPGCQYTADRDYIASVNIYRVYQEARNNRFSLKAAKPVSYTGTGIPLNCPSGASTQMLLGG